MQKKIMVVDDDSTSNTLVSFLLKSSGYETVVASDGEEALNKAKEEKPDLIVLDVGMPKMDGFTFLGELKRVSGSQCPPIIMLTAKDQMQDIFRMEGVLAYFVKPLDSDKFLSKVRRYFEKQAKQ